MKKIVLKTLMALMVVVLCFIWWPNDVITYRGKDLVFRIAISFLLIGFGGLRLISLSEKL